MGYLFTAAPAKRSHCSLPWTRGYLLTATLPDLQRGIAPLGPPAPTQPRLLGRGVGPPGHRPWPLAWGCKKLDTTERLSLSLMNIDKHPFFSIFAVLGLCGAGQGLL